MLCPKCGSKETIEIRGKIFCTSCGSTIQGKRGGEKKKSTSYKNFDDSKIIESKEFAVRPSYTLLRPLTNEPLPLLKQPKQRGRSILKPLILIITISGLVIFIILLFTFKPLIDFRHNFIKKTYDFVQKETQPVYQIDNFKTKIKLTQEKANEWNSEAYLTFVDISDDPTFKPINFSTSNTYHCVFISQQKNEAVVFFIHRNNNQIVGNIKLSKKEINIPHESGTNMPSIKIDQVKFISDEVFPVAEVNGLKSFLESHKDAKPSVGPVLEYSNKYETNYWLYVYKTPNNKHKFMAKVSADSGKILEVSQR